MMYSGKCLLPYRNLYWVVGCLGTWFKKKNYFRTCRTWPSCEPKTSSSHWKCQLYPIAKEICEERRQKDTGTALGRIYLSQRPGVLLDQACSEGHTTFRNSPLEEILGQGRQHLAETGREGDFILSDSLTGFCGTSVWTLFDHLDDPVKPPPPGSLVLLAPGQCGIASVAPRGSQHQILPDPVAELHLDIPLETFTENSQRVRRRKNWKTSPF